MALARRPDMSAQRPGTFVWFELLCHDVALAQAHYRALLDWTVTTVDLDGFRYAKFEAPHTRRGLGGLLPTIGHGPSRWISYLSVDNLERAAAAVQARGGELFGRPSTLPGVGTMLRIADPQGAALFLFSSATPATPRAPVEPGSWAGCDLWTHAPESATAFYAGLIAGAPCLLPGPPDAALPPQWVPRIRVADLEASVDTALELGAELMWRAEANVGHAVLRDPFGAMLSLVGSPARSGG